MGFKANFTFENVSYQRKKSENYLEILIKLMPLESGIKQFESKISDANNAWLNGV